MNGLMFNIMLVNLLKIVIVIFVLGLLSGLVPMVGVWMKSVVGFIFNAGEKFSGKFVPWGKKVKKEDEKKEEL